MNLKSGLMVRKKLSYEKRIIKYELTHTDKIILAIIGLLGVVLFFKGLSIFLDRIVVDPAFYVILGIILMLCSGYLIKRW
jgi:uncharacterized membrane protein